MDSAGVSAASPWTQNHQPAAVISDPSPPTPLPRPPAVAPTVAVNPHPRLPRPQKPKRGAEEVLEGSDDGRVLDLKPLALQRDPDVDEEGGQGREEGEEGRGREAREREEEKKKANWKRMRVV